MHMVSRSRIVELAKHVAVFPVLEFFEPQALVQVAARSHVRIRISQDDGELGIAMG
jgi:hypothetical protein